MTGEFCLGLSKLGTCSDFYNNQYTIMNIGVLLGILGVFLAAYQLLDENYKFRIKYKYTLNCILWLLGISLGISFVGGISPYFLWKSSPLFGYHIFYEIISTFLVLLTLIIGGWHISNPINPKTEKDFENLLKLTIKYLTKGDKYADAYISELYYFIDNLFHGVINGKKYINEIFVHLLNRNSIDNIIENNPGTLDKILKLYTDNIEDFYKFTKNNIILEEFFQSIFFSSLANEKSFISRELNEEINKHYKNGFFIDSILGSFKNIHYLGLLEGIPYNINIKIDNKVYYHNFIIFFNKSFHLFLDNGNKEHNEIEKTKKQKEFIENLLYFYKSIYFGFSQISGAIKNNYKDLRLDIDIKGFDSQIGYKLRELSSEILTIYGSDFPKINYDLGKLSHYLGNDGNLYVKNFLDAIAFGLFDCYLSASKDIFLLNEDEQGWRTRSLVMHIDSFLGYDKRKVGIILEIQKRINLLFEIKITKNLEGDYPMSIKSFFYAYGYQIFTKNDEDNWNDFYKKILKIIAEKLPELIKGHIYSYNDDVLKNEYHKNYALNKAKKIFEDLFPENMKYDQKKNELYYYYLDNASWSCIDLNVLLKRDIIKIRKP